MDLEDSFTESLLSKRKATKEFLNSRKADSPVIVGKKRSALVEEQQISYQGVYNEPPEESPKRQCIEHTPEKHDDEIEKENYHMEDENMDDSFVPFKVSSGRGLAALRRKNPMDKDHEEETKSQATLESEEAEVKSPVKKATKLNENDSVKSVKEQVQKEIVNQCPVVPMIHKHKDVSNTNGLSEKMPDLNRSLDPAELPLSARKALFEKSAFGGSTKPSEHAIEPKLTIAQRAALFEKAANKDFTKPKTQKDFGIQRQQGKQKLPSPTKPQPAANIPPSHTKLQTATSIPPPPPMQSSPVKAFSVQNDVKVAMKNSPVKKSSPPIMSPLSPNKEAGNHIRLMQQKLVERAASNWQEKDIVAKAVGERKEEISSLVNRHQKSTSSSSTESNWQEKDIVAKAVDKRKEISSLGNCHQKSTSSSSIESNASGQKQPMSLLEEEEYASEMESVYTERESLSEFEVKTQQDDEEVMESSYSDHENQDLNDQYPSVYSNEEDPDVFSHDEDPDEYNHEEDPDELDHEENPDVFNDEDEGSNVVEPELRRNEVKSGGRCIQPKYSHTGGSSNNQSSQSSSVSVGSSLASRSLSVSSNCSNGSSHDASQERQASVDSADKPLQYTVSFYRKQKQATRTPPMKTIVRRERVESPPSDDNKAQVIQERINLLQEEILLQQNIISQTSQALNLCHATAEFSGSSEQVEGERLLLIATQKRQACLNEIQRLKSHGAQKENPTDGAGSLIITDIQLPLKRDFIAAQLEGKLNDAVHCFLCLIRHGAQVIVTQMMSTDDKVSDGSLCFTNHIKLQNLPPDLSVVFEVYALQTKKEQLPHDKKYHIKREQSKIRITPKGKKGDAKLILPAISSPGGPNAVRSSSFGVVGFTRFTTQNCHKKCFTLDKVPFTSPLEGVLKVKLQLHAEHKVTEKGFLTMFDLVAGFGAWHRRWCYLNAQYLAYWKYPDDENKKEPIGIIDLKKCVTGQVKLIARDICARQNTFELLTIRPREKGDAVKEQGNLITTTRHLLSADTKEERILWCNKLNEALANVRKWDTQALRPIETEQADWTYPSSK